MEDSRHFYFTWIARGYQEACLYLGDAIKQKLPCRDP